MSAYVSVHRERTKVLGHSLTATMSSMFMDGRLSRAIDAAHEGAATMEKSWGDAEQSSSNNEICRANMLCSCRLHECAFSTQNAEKRQPLYRFPLRHIRMKKSEPLRVWHKFIQSIPFRLLRLNNNPKGDEKCYARWTLRTYGESMQRKEKRTKISFAMIEMANQQSSIAKAKNFQYAFKAFLT